MRVDLHPEARAELLAAALWYDERQAGLGDRLVQRVSATLLLLSRTPKAYPVWRGTTNTPIPIHKAAIEQFPYHAAFEVHDNRILVLAIAHAKRRPLYRLSRATPASDQ